MKRALLVVCVIFILSFPAFAGGAYFDFTVNSRFVLDGSPFDVSFVFDISGADPGRFVVRPIGSSGLVSIMDLSTGRWVGADDPWSVMPALASAMPVRVRLGSLKRMNLRFQIRDSVSNRIYETPDHTVWDKGVSENYLQNLDLRILGEAVEAALPSEAAENTSKLRMERIDHSGVLSYILIFSLSALLTMFWDYFKEIPNPFEISDGKIFE
ncbi:hypothetical protein HYW61_00680 [candidate division WWE3 bacterium]|nr:hypothetical protein [candidate division WWE3 bacterium]